MKNEEFRNFCDNLRGFKMYLNHIEVPKYILFWKGYKSHDILTGKTNINLIER